MMPKKPGLCTIPRLLVGIIASLGFSISQGLAQKSNQDESVRAHREIAYVDNGHERQRLDLYVPESATPQPLVVWVHGGGCDASRLVVWGSSAGGHLVAMLGTTGDPNTELDDIAGVASKLVVLPGAGHGGPEFMAVESREIIGDFLRQRLKPTQ